MYISRLCYDVSVRLSVRLSLTQVHWRIIANLGFKFRSKFTAHCGRGAFGCEGRDHRREELRDYLALCEPLLGPFVHILLQKQFFFARDTQYMHVSLMLRA